MAKEKTNAVASAAAAAAPKKKRSIVKYFKDARSEFKKVVWPSRKQVVNNTIVVIIALVVSGIAIWALDTGFGSLLMLILGRTG
ncbi:MAG: preprotein translocase subunit SecE [Ruminiclostridium sp.]|nr:preprotein translocase subunit SecE [Ruminiclostridium sp.]